MAHTCQGTADKRGRIISSCEDCHWTAYHEGIYLGATGAVKDAAKRIVQALQEACDPLQRSPPQHEDEDKALQNWKTFQKMTHLVREAVEPMIKEAGEEFTKAKEKRQGDPNPS